MKEKQFSQLAKLLFDIISVKNEIIVIYRVKKTYKYKKNEQIQ